MDGITLGRASLLCTLLLWAFQVCSEAVAVKTSPTLEVMKGETAKLPCTYTGTQSSTIVEWYYETQGARKRVAYRTKGGEERTDDKTLLTGRAAIGEDFTLTISSVGVADEMTYYCQVTAGAEGGAESSTLLKVFFAPEKPEINKPSAQGISVDLPVSSEIGTCVTKNGHPQPRIIWFKDDTPLPEVKDRTDNTYMVPSVVKEATGLLTIKSTLYMRPTKADKDSKFHCTVEYSMPKGEIKKKESEFITINLNYPSEKATFNLVNKGPVKEGDTVKMECRTDGNPQPDFEFTKDEQPITGEFGVLTLKSVKRTDSGTYKCNGLDYDNLEADLSASLNLNVHYIDPLKVTPAAPQVIKIGDKVEWKCEAKGSDPPMLQWKKGSDVISHDGVLSIQEASYDNAGDYVCVALVANVPGLTAEANINLTVKGKPKIVAPAPGEVTKEGDSVTLKCTAYGFPVPQFTWKPSGKQSIKVEGNKAVSTVTLPTTADVMKNGVLCEASNEFGTDNKTFPISLKRAFDNSAEGRAFSLLLILLSSLLLSGLFVV